jgi:hypothetical protein
MLQPTFILKTRVINGSLFFVPMQRVVVEWSCPLTVDASAAFLICSPIKVIFLR